MERLSMSVNTYFPKNQETKVQRHKQESCTIVWLMLNGRAMENFRIFMQNPASLLELLSKLETMSDRYMAQTKAPQHIIELSSANFRSVFSARFWAGPKACTIKKNENSRRLKWKLLTWLKPSRHRQLYLHPNERCFWILHVIQKSKNKYNARILAHSTYRIVPRYARRCECFSVLFAGSRYSQVEIFKWK